MRIDPRPAQRRGVSRLTCSGDARAGEQMLAFGIEVVDVTKAEVRDEGSRDCSELLAGPLSERHRWVKSWP
jgi:hypothetical protein